MNFFVMLTAENTFDSIDVNEKFSLFVTFYLLTSSWKLIASNPEDCLTV